MLEKSPKDSLSNLSLKTMLHKFQRDSLNKLLMMLQSKIPQRTLLLQLSVLC